jgi:hypothetical protein
VEKSKRPDPVIEIYKGYRIEAFEREKERWRTRTSRVDGAKIKVKIPPMEESVIESSGDALTADRAIDEAKKAIDGWGGE